MNEPSWNSIWSDDDDKLFNEALNHVYGIGYVLAASKLLVGR